MADRTIETPEKATSAASLSETTDRPHTCHLICFFSGSFSYQGSAIDHICHLVLPHLNLRSHHLDYYWLISLSAIYDSSTLATSSQLRYVTLPVLFIFGLRAILHVSLLPSSLLKQDINILCLPTSISHHSVKTNITFNLNSYYFPAKPSDPEYPA